MDKEASMEHGTLGQIAGNGRHLALPTLYGITSTGRLKQWTVGWFEEDEGHGVILRKRHGQVGGTLVNSDKRVKPKSNRTILEQARLEAESAFKKQLDVGMVADLTGIKTAPPANLPMLVKTYKDHPEKITFPAYMQPKLNGVRCLADMTNASDPQYISRKNKRYNGTVAHFTPQLLDAGEPTIWDGEIYRHGWSFAKVLQRVKQVYPDTDQLQYWVYDVADEALTFEERHKLINQVLKSSGPIVICPTVEVNSDAEVWKYHDECVAQGFEGAIIRNKLGAYRKGLVRSYDVMRVKNFHDAEFKIIGGKAEEVLVDRDWVNCVVFECNTESGKSFSVRPRGDVETRAQMYSDLDKLVGKELTVRYAEFSEDGIPIMPVGIAIRDYE